MSKELRALKVELRHKRTGALWTARYVPEKHVIEVQHGRGGRVTRIPRPFWKHNDPEEALAILVREQMAGGAYEVVGHDVTVQLRFDRPRPDEIEGAPDWFA